MRRASQLLPLLLLSAVLLLLPSRFTEDAQLQEPTAIIGQEVLDILQTEGEVDVLISLKGPDIPFTEWTTELRRQNAAERAASVLSVLTPSDFTLLHQFEISAALSGRLTESGLEKLANHPDVVAVGFNGGLFIPGRERIDEKTVP